MRCLYWCSAALVLAGCGGAKAHDPFAYTRAKVTDEGVHAAASWATIRKLSIGGVPAYVVVPRRGRTHPAVLFLHGSGGTREDLVGQAAVLARRGVVTMTISYPNDTETYAPPVVAARRALDALAARPDVDPARLGVVGFSLGGQLAAVLAGDDRRVRAADIIGGRGNAVTLFWIRRAKAKLFFQAGSHDEVVPHAQLLALMHAAPGHPRVRWYPVGHLLSKQIDDDLVDWTARTLG